MVRKSLALGLGVILMVITSCKQIKDPEFRRLDSFRIKNIGFQHATIGFSVTYYNPNNFGVSAKEAEADVYIDSVYLGKFTQDSTVSVRKTSEFSIPISASIPIQTALKFRNQDLPNGNINIKADGSIKVGKAGVYVTRSVHYTGQYNLGNINLGSQ